MIKQSKLIADLKELANGKSMYRNAYPYNLLYWDGTRFWADCVNLYKALFNGRDIHDKTIGRFQANLSITTDCSEWGLLSKCSDVSQDFSRLKKGEFRCLYKDGHFGGYLGEELIDPSTGGLVNVVESTPAWLNGIQFSYVDNFGRRYQYKGGAQGASWTHHGKPTAFVSYNDIPVDPKIQLIMDWQTSAKADGLYGGYIDGDFGAMSAKASEGGVYYGSRKKNLVIFWQKWLRDKGYYTGTIDGDFGNMTKDATIRAQGDYKLEKDGSIGIASTRAFLGV